MIDQKQLNECLLYIDSYWDRIIHSPKDSRQDPHLIPLRHPYVSPNDTSHWKASLFYWDTYFIFRGMVGTKDEWIMPKVVGNFSYLLQKYGIIPNATVWAFLGHSQPPFLSSMVFDGYYAIKRSGGVRGMVKKQCANFWLSHYMKVAKSEYEHVCENNETYYHKVEEYVLSRYGDRDVGYALTSERESGWDFTTRFYNRCNDFLPVDLNSYLHKYEKDFARAAHILRRRKDEVNWEEKAQIRHDRMKKLMWNSKEGFFFDYDYINKLQSKYYSLAGFVPMWAKLATSDEAKQIVKKLPLFETAYGLTITAKISMPPPL